MNETLLKLAEKRLDDIHEEIYALEMEAEELMGLLDEECDEDEYTEEEIEINADELDEESRKNLDDAIKMINKLFK